MPDRKTVPEIKSIDKIEIIRASEQKLSSGIPVYTVNAGTQDLLKLEFLFNAGLWYQDAPLVASAVNDLIDEGTAKLSSSQIAERIDYYGAYLETECAQDFASVNLYTLTKHLPNVLPVIEDILKNSLFPEKELSINLQNKRQKFLVNEQKVNYAARKKFNELLFGRAHPYGISADKEDFAKVKREQLVNFHRQNYTPQSCRIIVAGKISDNVIELLEKHFGNWKDNETGILINTPPLSTMRGKHLFERNDAIQSALRIGRILFKKNHEDYLGMTVLNTILGGYFGSRLMSNIREDKGYTYGIGSAMVPLVNEGVFFVSSEVGAEVCSKAIDEIYFEMKRLRETEVSREELDLVRNYMLGTFLGDIDGPFHLANAFKGIMVYGLNYDFYDRYIRTIRTITPSELMQLANRYLLPEIMVEVVVGKK